MKQSTLFTLLLLAACNRSTEKLTELPPVENTAGQAVSVETVTVARSVIERSVLATGTTEPVRAANLGPQMTGRVSAVMVEEGDVVKAGTGLVRLDAADAEIRLRGAEASAASTQSQYQLAASEYDRLAPLAAQGTVTPQQLERLASQRDALKAAADASRSAAENARHVLTDALVRAPFAGVVSKVNVEVGEVATMVPVTVLVRLVDLSSVDVRMRVHERDLARMRVGDSVYATFPSTGERLEGTIAFVSPEIDTQTRTAEVVTRIPNDAATLRAGMFAEIAVRSQDKHEGLVLPVTALGSSGDQQFVLVVEGAALVRRTVRAATVDAERVEVLDGLTPGDVVVVRDITRLGEGQKVTVAAAGGGGEK